MTGVITTAGRQFEDWSADYRLFSKERFDPSALFDIIRRELIQDLGLDRPLVVAMDDTISRKKGRKIPGTAWRRDPMSPPFQANLVWGRRFIQVSAIMPSNQDDKPGRAIPVDFFHAPTAIKPKKNASAEQWSQYRRECRTCSLAQQGVDRLRELRHKMVVDGEDERPLWVSVDGSYTNATVIKNLPHMTTMVGRIRKDARLHPLPGPRAEGAMGRTRQYGREVITPEAVRKDKTIQWQQAQVFAAGKVHTMRYKTITPLLWRSAGPDRPLRLIVIAPLAYKLTPGSKVLYRRPAFLISTDPEIDPVAAINTYVSRWDIEVNIRDEKQLLGFDEAQVRNPASASLAPAFAVSAYAILLLAATRAFGVNGLPAALPPPKWRAKQTRLRPSTPDLLNHLRYELWGRAITGSTFSRFMDRRRSNQKPQNVEPSLASSLFYARPGG
jgi:hypothetical protein